VRILHLVHQYPPDYVGGTERYTQSVAYALRQRGHDVAVLSRRSADGHGVTRDVEGDVQVWAAWDGEVTALRRFVTTFRSPVLLDAFSRVLRATRPDLIHIQHLMAWPVALLREIREAGIPFVVTLHDYWWVCANALLITNYNQELCDGPHAYVNCARCALARGGTAGLWPFIPPLAGLLFWRNQALRRFLEAAEKVIVPSKFVRDWYTAHGLSEGLVTVIPHGLEVLPQLPRVQLDRTVRFAYIGGLAWHKGVHVIVDAFHDVKGDAELWIVGDASADPGYGQHLHTLATPKVRFLGRLPHDEIWRILSEVDVVVVPSLCYESFSLVVREAFAAGLPVVASDFGALAEAVKDGVDGLCVHPGDVAAWRAALQQFVDDPELLPRLRANVCPPFTLEEHVERLESLYVQCVDSQVGA